MQLFPAGEDLLAGRNLSEVFDTLHSLQPARKASLSPEYKFLPFHFPEEIISRECASADAFHCWFMDRSKYRFSRCAICFHASSWHAAVSVRTPSKSKSTACGRMAFSSSFHRYHILILFKNRVFSFNPHVQSGTGRVPWPPGPFLPAAVCFPAFCPDPLHQSPGFR